MVSGLCAGKSAHDGARIAITHTPTGLVAVGVLLRDLEVGECRSVDA